MAILTRPGEDELRELVAGYRLGDLLAARGIEAGTVNTSYALDLGAGRYFLRIYEEQDAEGAAREAKVLTHLSGHGVLTPAPVVALDGATLKTVLGKPAAIFPWVDGGIVCQAGVTLLHANEVGRALARIHRAGHAPDAPLDAGRFGPRELEMRCERVALSSDPEARVLAPALRAAALAAAERRDEDEGRAPSGLVHGDLFRDNVLWDPQNPEKIAALLDFESAHDGPFAYDVAVAILSWSYGSTLDLGIARALVEGYRSVRELERADRAVLYDELLLAALRFTITRITDDAIRVGKRWQRFVERRHAIESLGRQGVAEALGL
ncbi:MAG: homoserine kinase [Labilithrix sp.]|nr:homoserine kinase [Labilithrix sp.]MCW5814815.1 homoserine kinase [Labilithrix sp.]